MFKKKELNVIHGDVVLDGSDALCVPKFHIIYGDLVIEGTGLTDIFGFTDLVEVTGNVRIANNQYLTNLDSLLELQAIGGDLIISNNPKLENIKGLFNLNVVRWLSIVRNNSLYEIGFMGLERIKNGCSITDNEELLEYSFPYLESIFGGFSVYNNPKLNIFCDFPELKTMTGKFHIIRNGIEENTTELLKKKAEETRARIAQNYYS